MWDQGFSERELWRGAEPMRWTTGRAALIIPVTGRSPTALQVDLAATGQKETELEIEVNGRELVDTDISPEGWTRTLKLPRVASRGEIAVEIKSTRSRYPSWLYGSPRPYRRGVLVRGLHLLDAEEEAALAAPSTGGPLRYRLSLNGRERKLRATAAEPLVMVLKLENAGADIWPGRVPSPRHSNPRIALTWHPAGVGPEIPGFQVAVARPVLPGGALRQAIAAAPRDSGGRPLKAGNYDLRLTLEWTDGSAPSGSEALVLPVEVRRASTRFFAPVRLLARHVRPSDPPFTLTPF